MSQPISKLPIATLPLSGGDIIVVDQSDPTTPSGYRSKRALIGALPNFTPVTLAIGQPLGYVDTGVNLSVVSTTAGYNQVVSQNKSAATNASTNFNVSNNLATATTNFGEFGMNSSTFVGSGSFNLPGAVYVAAATTDLVLGTYGANAIHFVVNNGTTDAGTVNSAGAWTIPTLTTNFIQSGTSPLTRTAQDKARETVNIDDFQNAAGLAPGLGGDDTKSLNDAISATIKNGGFGTVVVSSGKVYNFSGSITTDGVLGLTIKGKNGGNVGNLSSGSSAGAATLNFTNATGDSFAFTGVAYHAAQIVMEDLAVFANTSGTTLSFNNFSQININRCTFTNAGGTTSTTGNILRFSNCYYTYCNASYFWKSGTLYTVGQAVTIDKGALSTFLGGLYNFTNCSFYGCYNGFVAGNATPGASANENYASINLDGCEFNGNNQGALLLYGVKSFSATGCYVEGNLGAGFVLANQPRNVSIKRNFFNNSTAGSADILLGQNGSGTSYTQFYDIDISQNHFLGVNKFGILTASSGAGSSVNIEGNEFILATALAVGISASQSAVGNLRATVRNNSFYGFPVGTSMAGYFTTQHDNHEYNAAGAFIGSWKQANLLLPSFATFTQIQPNDPDTTTITNTTAGARFINATPSDSKNRRQFVTLTAASSQNVGLYKSDAATLMATLVPGKGAIMWNDGTNEYASLLP